MFVRDHIKLSTVGAIALYPMLGPQVIIPWASSILIDGDHYLWYVWKFRRFNPLTAYHFFMAGADSSDRRRDGIIFHTPLFIGACLVISFFWYPAALATLGLVFHRLLDVYDDWQAQRRRPPELRALDLQRAALLEATDWACGRCGARGLPLRLHRLANDGIIMLCPTCSHAEDQRTGKA